MADAGVGVDPLPQVLAGLAELTEHPLVLLDGPSGAGKSTLADRIVAHWPGEERPLLVRMDDLYPGWGGLEEASAAVARDLVEPLAAGRAGAWRRWDWTAGCVAEVVVVEPGRPVLVEGCGALSGRAAAVVQLRLWLDARSDIRKRRALDRDAGVFDGHWDMWQRQFDAFAARESPRERADLLLDGSGPRPVAATVEG